MTTQTMNGEQAYEALMTVVRFDAELAREYDARGDISDNWQWSVKYEDLELLRSFGVHLAGFAQTALEGRDDELKPPA